MKQHWGYHLVVDASKCNQAINEVQTVGKFLKTMVDVLEMHPIGKPTLIYVDTDEGRGVSGVQIITTSTLTFHGDEDRKCAFIDIFSCKEYDINKVVQLIRDYFSPEHIKQRVFYRDAN